MQKVLEVCRFKHYSLATEANYAHWTGRYAGWLAKRHADLPEDSTKRMEAFLTALAQDDVSASTQNQAFHAIRFFYTQVLRVELGHVDALRAKRPKFLRHAPPRDMVRRLLSAVQDTPQYPYRLIIFLIYGWRPARRRATLHPPPRHRPRIPPNDHSPGQGSQGSDGADPSRAHTGHQTPDPRRPRRVRQQVPVKLPHQLGRKYKSADFEWDWFWLFPASGPCRDPRSGEMVWWHCLPEGVQKALRRASRRIDAGGSITPHHLRHAWATHAHDDGASVRDLQEILGHKSLETTMIYVHPEAERVTSPIETLGVL